MKPFTVIAHRGACGYLPEHTLEGAALAHGMGADYIELDVVLTRDRQLAVLHDLFLDAVTNVAQQFPGRSRPDGRHYAIDFTMSELKTLHVNERVREPAFPRRFPVEENIFLIPSFEEMIALLQGLNHSTGREIGLYIEPKSPEWHQSEGDDIVLELLESMAGFGYSKAQDKACLQSFDMKALMRARNELQTELKLVQLIGDNSWGESSTDFDYCRTKAGLNEIAEFAAGIGPWLPQIVDIEENRPSDISDLIDNAHAAGLFVHAYTLRADQLPKKFSDLAIALEVLVENAGLDGVFTDHPDQVVRYLSTHG
jgi:glycerophosphoryl diester phosphodiesterase